MKNRPDIIAITEVMSKRYTPVMLAEFSIKGYNVISNDLENIDNRGLLIYINNKYEYALVNTDSKFKEILMVKIKKLTKLGKVCCLQIYIEVPIVFRKIIKNY